jgi:hypothetical protein
LRGELAVVTHEESDVMEGSLLIDVKDTPDPENQLGFDSNWLKK